MTAFWRRLVDEPDAFPPEFWQLFLQSSLTVLGEKCRPVRVGMIWRRLTTAGAMRQWRPRLEEVNREVRQFGITVPGGVEHVGLRARTLHETGNWLVINDCSNDLNTVKNGACGGSQLCPSAHAVCGQVLRYKASERVLSDGLGGNQNDPFLQRCPTRRPHGAGIVLSYFATRAKVFHEGIQERSGSLRVHRRCLS